MAPITMTANLTGRTRTSARSRRGAAIGLVAAVASAAAVLVFSANLTHLIDSPVLQGWNFDVLVGNPSTQSDQQATGVPLLAGNPLVGGFTSIASPLGGLSIDGRPVNVVGVDADRGDLYPTILDGRPPHTADEIILARRTLAELHRHIGDNVTVTAGAHEASMRIVGEVMNTSAGDVLTGRLDQGGVVTLDGLRRLVPNAIVTLFAVRYRPGVDPNAAAASLQRDFGPVVLRHVIAQDVANVDRVRSLPALLAALIALLAIAGLAQALISGVVRGRKDLAVARTCGFVGRQLAATVWWRTWWLTLWGLAIGLPLGIIIGRTAWRIVARQIGTTGNPFLPTLALLVIAPAALAITTMVAALPAWTAARVKPAEALRSE